MKLATKRKCPDGEVYVFKNGVAEVKGMRSKKGPYTITLAEFNNLCKEAQNEKIL